MSRSRVFWSASMSLCVLLRVIRAHFPEGRINFPHLRILVVPVRVIASDHRDSALSVDANGWAAVRAVPAVRQVSQRR